MKTLLSKGTTNSKTAKNELKTFILYLSSGAQNSKGINICPKASKGCLQSCLYTAGRGIFENVKEARINKTEFFLDNKPQFITQLAIEIIKEYNKAKKGGYKIAFRLNGTSDLDFVYLLKKYANLFIEDLKEYAIFYDYTKIIGKAKKYLNHPNYIVTFSRSEDNEKEVEEALQLGINTAIVFSGQLPKSYKGTEVVDGDVSDLVMLDYKGIVLGLKAKGEAKKDLSGFVVTS